MKKFFAMGVAALLASASFAAEEEAEKKTSFSAELSGLFYGTAYTAIDKKIDTGSYSCLRMRPQFTISNGNLDAVLRLEYDGVFGSETAGDDKSSENVSLGTDKTRLEVAQAYLKSKIEAVNGLNVIAGLNAIDYPLIYGENVPMFNVNYSNEMLSLSLYYVKIYEGKLTKNYYNETRSEYVAASDDSQMYIADATITMGKTSLRPAFFVYNSKIGANAPAQFQDGRTYIGGINFSSEMDFFGIDATVSGAKGKNNLSKVKYLGYAADVAPFVKVGDFKFTGFFTLVSGDDPETTGKDESWFNSTIDSASAGMNIWRLYIIEDGATMTTNSDVAGAGKYSLTNGYMAAGLRFDTEINGFSIMTQGAWTQAQKVASGTKKGMGIEIDANISYEISKGTSAFIEGAFLKTGDFYGKNTQNANYISGGMNYTL